ncbi:hypothetical protein QQ045_005478 [Rhodiola kirilowii]
MNILLFEDDHFVTQAASGQIDIQLAFGNWGSSQSAEDASKAVGGLNGKILDDKEWYVGKALKNAEREIN